MPVRFTVHLPVLAPGRTLHVCPFQCSISDPTAHTFRGETAVTAARNTFVAFEAGMDAAC